MSYSLPIDFHGFFKKAELVRLKKQPRTSFEFRKTSDLKESIDEFIELLVFTHPGECKFANDFGFNFWEYEFSNLSIDTFNNTENPRRNFENNLKEAILKYEPRLSDVKVEVLLSEENLLIKKTRIKFLVMIFIQGFIKGIQKEPYRKNLVFSMGPVIKK